MYKFIKQFATATSLSLLSLSGAQATFNIGIDVFSDPGTYDPVALGETLNLSACGSDVRQSVRGGSTPASNRIYGLCTLDDLTDFTITWNLTINNITQVITSASGVNAASALNVAVNTGIGSLFNAPGNYQIGLIVDIPSTAASFVLPDNNIGRSQCDAGIRIDGITYGTTPTCSLGFSPNINGHRNTGFASTSVTINRATIPEPSSALLLLPAVAALVARRKRKAAR